jgi:hypothetical protein
VERNHGTHQDRLVKQMRRRKIRTHAEADLFLETEYLPEHNLQILPRHQQLTLVEASQMRVSAPAFVRSAVES